MNDDQLNDLKQFIANTVAQTEVRLTGRIDGLEDRIDGLESKVDSLAGRMDRLEAKVDDGFAGIGEAIDQLNQRLDDDKRDTDRRLTKLERQHAA